MRTRVRAAELDDIPWLLTQLLAFAEFFGTRRSLFPDESYARVLLQRLVQHPPFLVAEQDGRPVGFIAGVVAPHPLNPEIRVLSELFWWVDEAYRGGRAGFLLFDAYCDYGERNADWILCTLEANSPVNPASLERRHFVLRERTYLREVQPATEPRAVTPMSDYALESVPS